MSLKQNNTTPLTKEAAIELLTPFCAPEDDHRDYLKTVFSFDGLTWATAGHVIVCVFGEFAPALSGCEGMVYDNLCTSLNSILNSSPNLFGPPPEIHFKGDGWLTCKECSGKRVIEFDSDYNNYECTCKSCEGDGGFNIKEQVIIPGMRRYYDADVLRRLLALPGVEIGRSDDIVCFRFDYGLAFLSGAEKTHTERRLEQFQ